MNSVVKASAILAGAVAVLSIAFTGAGLHENPMMGLVLLLVFIVLNIGVVIWALKQTAAVNGYGKQLMNGALIGLLGGVLILVASVVIQTYIFPDSMQESRDAAVAMMEGLGMPEAQLDAAIAKLDQTTPMGEATKGMIGTFVTSLIIAAIGAIFLRKK